MSLGHVPLTLLLIAVFALPVASMVRGYEIERGKLTIRRLLWRTQVRLGDTPTAAAHPGAMVGSSSRWGSHGFFSYSGWFSNGSLGRYRAFVTDRARTVVVRTAHGVTVVISPDDPIRFLMAVDLLHLGALETSA